MKKIFSMILLLIAVSVYGQAEHKDLLAITKAYAHAEKLSMDVEVTMYKDKWDKKGTPVGKGVMRKAKGNYYSRFLSDELISNSSCTMVIDHSDKSVAYFKGGMTSKKPKYDIADISSMLARNDSVVFKKEINGVKHYIFYYAKGIVIQTDLYVDSKSSFVKKLEYTYRKSTPEDNYDAYKIVIEYKNIVKDVTDNKIFSEERYVTFKKGQPVLLQAYQSYQLTVAEKE